MAPRVGRVTLQHVLTLALEASHATGTREFAEIALDGSKHLVACDVITYNEISPGGQFGLSTAVLTGAEETWFTPELQRAWESHAHEHPLIAHYMETGDGRALKISDLLQAGAFHALALYREFFAPLGVEHQIAVTLPAPKPTVIGLAFNRGDRDFTERDRAVLNTLRPYLARAHAAVRERERARLRLDALEQATEEVSDGIVVLGPQGRILDANPAARALVLRVLGIELDGVLPAALERPVVERDGRRLYARQVGGEAETGVLVLSTTPPPDTHGLTPRELEVLASAADGFTAGEIAWRLGLSTRTVEQHFRNAYRKLGVHGRAAAIARAFGTPHQAFGPPEPERP